MKKIFYDIALYFFSFIGLQLLITVLFSLANGALGLGMQPTDAGMLILIQSTAAIVTTLLFVLLRWCPCSLAFWRQKPWLVIIWSAIAALGALVPSSYLSDILPDIMRTDLIADQLRDIASSPLGYVALALMAPMVEEVVFRGAIQSKAMELSKGNKNGHWVGITLTALLFSVVHMNPAQMPHAFLLGLFMGWLRYRSGSIVPGIIIHWVNNSAAFALMHFVPQLDGARTIDIFGGDPLRLTGAILLSLILFALSIYQLHLCTKRTGA